MDLSSYLLGCLKTKNIDKIYSIPGDFLTGFCIAADKYEGIELVTLSHEPALGFAAHGYSIGKKGLSAVAVTYGVGAFNVLNTVAAAYAEKIPLIIIAGMAGINEQKDYIGLHHQVTGRHDTQRNVYKEVTAYQAIIDNPVNAVYKINKAISVCENESLPVYIELPRDLINEVVELNSTQENINNTGYGEGTDLNGICKKLSSLVFNSEKPLFVAGIEILRRGLGNKLLELAKRFDVPVATTFTSQSAVDEDDIYYIGSYMGRASYNPALRDYFESSDCLVQFGTINTDTNLGAVYSGNSGYYRAVQNKLYIEDRVYDNVGLDDFIGNLNMHSKNTKNGYGYAEKISKEIKTGFRFEYSVSKSLITVDELNRELSLFFYNNQDIALATDVGDNLYCSNEIYCKNKILPSYYLSMGFAVPASIGYEQACGKRVLALVGDGGFQMTGMELFNASKCKTRPVVLVMNNGCWNAMKMFGGERVSKLEDWDYSAIASLFKLPSWKVQSSCDLRSALDEAVKKDSPCLIDLKISPDFITNTFKHLRDGLKNRDHIIK